MVSTSEGVVYYCTVFLTAIVFLTEASAITTNYEKSTTQNKTNISPETSPQRTKLAPTRSRSNLSKNQNHDRVSPITFNKLKVNTPLETVPQNKSERELLLVSNTGGENNVKDKGGGNTDDDDQKTLSQQVADGKYGLIQHEIFTIKPTRPGVISYDVNPEVPKDNINNLGGLEPDDIWLAENHLLVLAGSGLGNMQNQWKPIDNYVAPKRQVQIPSNPKVPPPFPVQLSDDGPIEYIKSDKRPSFPFTSFHNPLLTQYKNFNNSQGILQYGKPSIGPLTGTIFPQLKPSQPINSNQPLPSPIYIKPPPGAEFIPPYLINMNTSDAIDEDDPSLYYPPPYDFYYPKDNTTKVPPGPLVPGIILPPPPHFFSLWFNNTVSKEIPKSITVKDKSRKPNTIFKSGKQLHYPTSIEATKPETQRLEEPVSKFITFNDIINEVTYPDMQDDKITYTDVKVNKVSTEEVNEDWIPIPAPKPFYITGEKKPSKNTVLVVMEPPESIGYNYNKPVTQLTIEPKRPLLKYLQYVDKPNEQYISTTPISPQLASTKSSTQNNLYTTTPLSSYQPPNAIKATYYFYEEPKFIDSPKVKSPTISTISPTLSTNSMTNFNDYYETKSINNYNLPKSIITDTKPIIQRPQESKRKPITPMIPIYYLAELDNLIDLVKPINSPYTTTESTPKHEYYTTTVKPTYTINKPSYERPTPKPISEYSYVASDYNGPINQNLHSTPMPINYHKSQHYPVDYNAHYQLTHYHQIYNNLPQFDKPIQTTANPVLLLNHYANQNTPTYNMFDKPWLQNLNIYNQIPFTTENPYYAFFTKEEEDLIDENTKKYFTIFGQKIKQNGETTSPLSVQTPASIPNNHWYSTKYGLNNNNIYPSQSSNDYYSSTTPYSIEQTSVKNPHKPTPTQLSTPTPPPPISLSTTYSKYKEQNYNNEKPLSLEGDTLVNYVTPLPEHNTDAEYVTPTIGKHIRPIVVEDLPPDLDQRLKNFMNLQHKNKNAQIHGFSSSRGNYGNSKNRYILIDNEYNDNHQPYPQNVVNPTYEKKYVQPYHQQKITSYQQHPPSSSTPVSLNSDILVNYRSPLKTDPEAEYISTLSKYQNNNLSEKSEEIAAGSNDQVKRVRNKKPVSLENDILVNYKGAARYQTNPDAEYIGSSEQSASSNRGSSSNNVVAFKYPNIDHGHFYFLTPQEAHLTQIEDERYDYQSNVEKPSSYFKRKPRNFEKKNEKSR